MSPELHAFYVAYATWLDAGAPDEQPFFRHSGLCHNLDVFISRRTALNGNNMAARQRAYDELREQLAAHELDVAYPFNNGDHASWSSDIESGAHLNPARVEWVRRHAAMVPTTETPK